MRTPAQLRLIRQASSGPEDSADTWRRRLERWMDTHPQRTLYITISDYVKHFTTGWDIASVGKRRKAGHG